MKEKPIIIDVCIALLEYVYITFDLLKEGVNVESLCEQCCMATKLAVYFPCSIVQWSATLIQCYSSVFAPFFYIIIIIMVPLYSHSGYYRVTVDLY